MIGITFLSRRFRTILDCCLILALILLLSAEDFPAQAKTSNQHYTKDAIVTEMMILSNDSPATDILTGVNPSLDLAQLDDNTLAAMIAAENAALTASQYLLSLPVILH